MMNAHEAYEFYCALAQQNQISPVWFEDGFATELEVDAARFSGRRSDVVAFSSARAQLKNISLQGEGKLFLSVGFGAILENVSISIGSGSLFLCVGPYCEIRNLSIQSFDRNWIVFGAGNTLNTGSILTQGDETGVVFGHDCMFSTNFHARTSDSHGMFSYATRRRINKDASIRVGDHTWIGRQVMINKGVWSADDVIFGQGAVVSGKTEGASCYAGVPARRIKSEVTWDRTRQNALSEVPDTYAWRPRQLAVNRFLLLDQPFHPNARRELAQYRQKFATTKPYAWMTVAGLDCAASQ